MVNGLYTARNGMMLIQQMVDNTSHNLANANTAGFKKSLMASIAEVTNQRNDEALIVHDESHSMSENRVSWQQGSLVETGNSLDVAIEGDGFLVVETPEGIRYSRSGNLTVNGKSELATLQGFKVLDDAGNPIVVEGTQIRISTSGEVLAGENNVARMAIVDFADRKELLREGRNTYVPRDPETMEPMQTTNYKLRQGYLEASNVNIVESMVEMIRFQRNYEMDQKAVHSLDETLQKAVNEIGRV